MEMTFRGDYPAMFPFGERKDCEVVSFNNSYEVPTVYSSTAPTVACGKNEVTYPMCLLCGTSYIS